MQLHLVGIGAAHFGNFLATLDGLVFLHQQGLVVGVGGQVGVVVLDDDEVAIAAHVFRVQNRAVAGGHHGLPGLTGNVDLAFYDAAGGKPKQSRNAGTTDESISTLVIAGQTYTFPALFDGEYMPPILHVNPGDVVRLEIDNRSREDTNVHYHGFNVSPLPGGDDVRRQVPPRVGDEAASFLMMNRNKRGFAIDNRSEAGRAVLKRLALSGDAFIENYLSLAHVRTPGRGCPVAALVNDVGREPPETPSNLLASFTLTLFEKVTPLSSEYLTNTSPPMVDAM